MANLWMSVTKDSALVAVVGYQELALTTRLAGANTKEYFLFFLAAAVLYLVITLLSNLVFHGIERRVRRASGRRIEGGAQMNFEWIAKYWPLLIDGAIQTVALLVISVSFGFVLAVGLAFARVSGGPIARNLALGYSTVFRGTPLLIQLWLLYYGIGSLLPMVPGLRQSFLWPILREGFFFAALSFTLNFAAYQSEVLRGALLSVPKGELEAGRSLGMSPWLLTRRIWLPRAIRTALPTIAGEIVLQLKATPLAFTVTVMDLYAVAFKVRQDTLLVYEPLIVVTLFYVALTALITRAFGVSRRRCRSAAEAA